MEKGKYFLNTLEKSLHLDKFFVDGEETDLISPCCEGNKVFHSDGEFICETLKIEKKGNQKIAHFFTSIEDAAPKKVAKKTTKKVTKKVVKKTTKKVTKKVVKKIDKSIKKD